MMDAASEPGRACGEHQVIYHQYIGDACCEGCGEWQDEVDTTVK